MRCEKENNKNVIGVRNILIYKIVGGILMKKRGYSFLAVGLAVVLCGSSFTVPVEAGESVDGLLLKKVYRLV